MTNGQIRDGKVVDVDFRQTRKHQRPSSMYETREGLKTPNWQTLKNQVKLYLLEFTSLNINCFSLFRLSKQKIQEA